MLAALDGQAATPFEVARRVFPEDLTDHQLRFALAETLAHLEHLEGEGTSNRWRTAWSAIRRSNPVLANEEEHARLIETARGDRPADLFVRGGTIANVYSGELHEGNVAVAAGRIAYVGEGERTVGPDTEIVDATGMIVSPGYIEAHCHPWVLYNPVSLVEGVLPLGTTTIVADNLFFFMQMGPDGFAKMASDLRTLPLLYFWMARLTSQARFPGEEAIFELDKVEPLLRRDDVLGTAEITRGPRWRPEIPP